MEDVHGKEISLQYVTVKIPGQKPRGSKTVNTSSMNESFVNFSISSKYEYLLAQAIFLITAASYSGSMKDEKMKITFFFVFFF